MSKFRVLKPEEIEVKVKQVTEKGAVALIYKTSRVDMESRSDGDGNEKKGEASDAFKRAGVQWGIGRELYTAPFIFLPLETVSNGKGYKLKNPFSRFDVKEIEYTESRKISKITIVDERGREVFQYPKEATKAKQTAKTEEWKLTKSELVSKYGDVVSNAEQCIAYYEKSLGNIPYGDWDEATCNVIRKDLEDRRKKKQAKEKREAGEVEPPFPLED